MVPGADDVLPLNVQLSVVVLVNVQVSDSVGPVTPKLAVAMVGLVTESVAEDDDPPYDAVTELAMVPPTARVEIVNIALVDPLGTVTVGGTVTASPLDNDTTAPPAGAAAVRVTVPVTWFPPTTLDELSEMPDSAAPDVTVSMGD
jgi:hypothetical protein